VLTLAAIVKTAAFVAEVFVMLAAAGAALDYNRLLREKETTKPAGRRGRG
jgi:hypothetical protein